MLRHTAFICLFAFASPAFLGSSNSYAQATSNRLPTDNNWNVGHELFQILLQQSGLNASRDLEDAFSNPEGSAIVVIGAPNAVQSETKLFENYVRQGGRLFITANAMSIPEIATIDPGPAFAERLQDEFEGFADCILLSDLSPTSPITKDLRRLVTNISGWIPDHSQRYRWEPLAKLPSSTLPLDARSQPVCIVGSPITTSAAANNLGNSQRNQTRRNSGASRSSNQASARNAAKPASAEPAPEYTQGGIIVLADPSIISNGMLWYEDNGHFTARLTNWLSAGNRSTVTFIYNNVALDNYPIETLLPPEERQRREELEKEIAEQDTPPLPPVDTLLSLVNKAILETAKADEINARLQNQPRYAPPDHYATYVFGFLLILGLLFISFLLLRKSTSFLNRLPPDTRSSAHQLNMNNLPEHVRNKVAAETIAKEFSTRWTGSHQETDWRTTLEELKYLPANRMPAKDRVQAESLLAIAIFGGRGSMTNNDLVDIGKWVRILLTRYPRLPTTKETTTA